MTELREIAPAKLNLCLYVGGKRDDGLHEIVSLFCPLDVADELVLEPHAGESDEVTCPGLDGENLAARALAEFRERFDWHEQPVRVTIDKRIPIAAGLGGGSADAAATLRLAVRASQITPEPGELAELAMSIGADVPSQIKPALQLVQGGGERFEPLAADFELHALLLTCRDGLSTADVYMHADSMYPPRSDLAQLAGDLRDQVAKTQSNALELSSLMHNDLQASAVTLEPATGDALDLVREAGAKVALVTGSGPTVFGLFGDRDEAQRARDQIASSWDGETIIAGRR